MKPELTKQGNAILHKGNRYNLIATPDRMYAGQYQILDTNEDDWEMPKIFDSYDDALESFKKLGN